jgi:hypothetical protein
MEGTGMDTSSDLGNKLEYHAKEEQRGSYRIRKS